MATEQIDGFAALVAAVTKAQQSIDAANRAQQAGDTAAYDARNVKVVIEARSYGAAQTEDQKRIAQEMIAFRATLEARARREASQAAVSNAAAALERARHSIPHLVAAAMIDLGSQAAALRAALASQPPETST